MTPKSYMQITPSFQTPEKTAQPTLDVDSQMETIWLEHEKQMKELEWDVNKLRQSRLQLVH